MVMRVLNGGCQGIPYRHKNTSHTVAACTVSDTPTCVCPRPLALTGGGLIALQGKVEGEGSRTGDKVQVGRPHHLTGLGRLIVYGLQFPSCAKQKKNFF